MSKKLSDFLTDDEMQHFSVCKIFPVGSRTIFQGFKDDSDWDFLVYHGAAMPDVMAKIGFKLDRGGVHYEPSQGKFNSWRKGEVNIILTHDRCFAELFLWANNTAVRMGLKDRCQRVKLFKAILYNEGKEYIQNTNWHPNGFESEDGLPW